MAAILTLCMPKDRYWEVFCIAETKLGSNHLIQISVFSLVLIKLLHPLCTIADLETLQKSRASRSSPRDITTLNRNQVESLHQDMQILIWFGGCTDKLEGEKTPTTNSQHFVSTWNISVGFPLKIKKWVVGFLSQYAATL